MKIETYEEKNEIPLRILYGDRAIVYMILVNRN